jgi:hypothetical protein
MLAKAIVTVALLAYFSESTYALNMLRCEPELASFPGMLPRLYLVNYPWQTCDTNDVNYSVVWRLAIVALSVYTVFVPIVSGILLFRNRIAILAGDERVEKWLGGLYDSYKKPFFWFEIVYFFRKVLLAIFISLFEGTPRIAAVLGVLQIALVLQLVLRPFKGRFQNALESFALVALSWNYSTATVAGLAGDVYVGVVCLVLDGAVLSGFIVAFLRPVYFKIREKCCNKNKHAKKDDDLAKEQEEPLFNETDAEIEYVNDS